MRVAGGQRLLAVMGVTWALAACGTAATSDADATQSGTDALASDTGATPSDTQVAETVDDAATADTPSPTASPAVQQCEAMATQLCAAAKTCCEAGASAACVADQTEACLKSGFAGLDDASAAGTVKPDATRAAACATALQTAAKACDRLAFQAARRLCLLAWTDAAKVGEDCAATAPIACDGGAGRCDPVTTDVYACKKAGATGDGCKLGAPCGIELECLNTTLTRAMECGTPGTTCHLSDLCPQGFKCDVSETCTPWADGGKTGAACTRDGDCAVGWACVGGTTCAPSLCGL